MAHTIFGAGHTTDRQSRTTHCARRGRPGGPPEAVANQDVAVANAADGGIENVGENRRLANRSDTCEPPKEESPGAVAAATGAVLNDGGRFSSTIYDRRLAKATRLQEALDECDPAEAAAIICGYLERIWTGPPAVDPLGDDPRSALKADAVLWAAGASEAELVEVAHAALAELNHRPLHRNSIKRLLVSAWRFASERLPVGEMRRFLSRIDGQGRFWGRGSQ